MKVEQCKYHFAGTTFSYFGFSPFLPGCLSSPLTIVQPGMAAKFSVELEDFFAGKAKIMVGGRKTPGVSSAG